MSEDTKVMSMEIKESYLSFHVPTNSPIVKTNCIEIIHAIFAFIFSLHLSPVPALYNV